MMERFIIWICTPLGYSHVRAFDEVAGCLQASLIDLGHTATIVREPPVADCRIIVLAPHLLTHFSVIPQKYIIYNMEQVCTGSNWISANYLDLLRLYDVWDYSLENIRQLAELGIRAKHCPVGYHAVLEKIQPAPVKDIDILHYGSLNDRRRKVLGELRDRGLNVVTAFDCYGAERDALIARAKIVLNIHFYEAKIFEAVRCSYLFANGVCVVSEASAEGGGAYALCASFCEYEELANSCMEIIQSGHVAEKIALMGRDSFKTMLQTEILKGIL